MKRWARILLLMAVCSLALGAGDGGDLQKRYSKLGNGMMCMCGCNQILLQCNHVGCSYSAKMTASLKEMLQRGDDNEKITAAFVSEYGPTVLAAPTTTGFNRVAWIMPYLAFALGTAGVVYLVRNWKLRPVPAPMPTMAGTPRELDPFREKARKETDL